MHNLASYGTVRTGHAQELQCVSLVELRFKHMVWAKMSTPEQHMHQPYQKASRLSKDSAK